MRELDTKLAEHPMRLSISQVLFSSCIVLSTSGSCPAALASRQDTVILYSSFFYSQDLLHTVTSHSLLDRDLLRDCQVVQDIAAVQQRSRSSTSTSVPPARQPCPYTAPAEGQHLDQPLRHNTGSGKRGSSVVQAAENA
jgi:hypothetical protein